MEFMTHLDTMLDAEKRSQLAALNVDLADAAFKVSTDPLARSNLALCRFPILT